ncbi:MAG: hypothetical protein FWG89_02375 [Treponema sp.]|nr:hypothetical protein [Treponema sp.]
MSFLEFWHNLQNAIGMAVPSVVFGVCILGILVIMLLCAILVENEKLAIILSALLGCVLMIPIVASYHNMVKIENLILPIEELEDLNRRAEIRRNEREILQQESELRRMAVARELQSIEIETLNESIKLLERTQLSIGNFREIFQVALLQTNIEKTTINREIIQDIQTGWGIVADIYHDELLVIISYEVDAKFGIDLEAIRIQKIDESSIVISGIHPMYIGAIANNHDRHVAEVRRVNLKDSFGENVLDTIEINNSRLAINFSEGRAWEYMRQFQENLNSGAELGFMDSAVIQLSQNFLKYIFSPFYTNIEFSAGTIPEAVPFMDYFQTEANALIYQRDMLLNNQEG